MQETGPGWLLSYYYVVSVVLVARVGKAFSGAIIPSRKRAPVGDHPYTVICYASNKVRLGMDIVNNSTAMFFFAVADAV